MSEYFGKKEIIEMVAEQLDMPVFRVKKVVNELLLTIQECLAESKDVSLPGFGKFSTRICKPRKHRNPATNGDIFLPSMRRPKFKFGTSLKRAVVKEVEAV